MDNVAFAVAFMGVNDPTPTISVRVHLRREVELALVCGLQPDSATLIDIRECSVTAGKGALFPPRDPP